MKRLLIFFLSPLFIFSLPNTQRETELLLRLPDASVDFVVQKILQKKAEYQRLHPHDTKSEFLFFSDYDGTIIRGDVTEGITPLVVGQEVVFPGFVGLAEVAIKNGLSNIYRGEEQFKSYKQRYEGLLKGGRAQRKDSIMLLGRIFSYLDNDRHQKLLELSQQYFEQSLQKQLFLSSLKIIDALQAEGIQIFVISASPDIFVKASAPFIHVPRENLSGIDLAEYDYPPFLFNYIEGKIQRMNHILQKRRAEGKNPIVVGAMGDSWISDLPMIRSAIDRGHGVGIMINSKRPPEVTSTPTRNFYHVHFKRTFDMPE